MAKEEEEVETQSNLLQPSSPFLEIICKGSSNVRRFAVGTEAGFALRLINRKLDSGIPLASYIEAVKEGEEPISFGPNAVLVDYGYGWKLQTVIDEGFVKEKGERTTNEQTPDVVQKTDNLQRSTSELKPHISFPYIGRIVLALTFIILLGVMFTLALENLPRLFLFVTSSM